MADHTIGHVIAAAHRTAQKNALLSEASEAATPWLAMGNIPGALAVLEQYVPDVERVLEQERLYAAETPGGTK